MNVPEEDEQGGQDQPHSDVEQHQAADGVEKENQLPGKRDTVNDTEDEKHAQRQPEVDQCLDIFREQEHILRHIDLGKDPGISHQRGHPLRGRLIEIAEHKVAAKQIGGIVRHTAPEKLREHQPHDQQRQQRRQHAPEHTENGSFVFLFKVAFDQFFEEELVFF